MFGITFSGERRTKLALLGALLAVAAISLAATTPSARQAASHALLACGDTVTSDVTLSSDLSCAGSDGLRVGANGIKIDLDGHTISGDGTHSGIINNGHTNVVIKNGQVSHFLGGIVLQAGADGNTVKNVRAFGNGLVGIGATGSDDVNMTGNYTYSNDTGIALLNGSGGQVAGNTAEGNTSDGIFVNSSSSFVISGNAALNNSKDGIHEEGDSSGQLTSNVANGNINSGVFLASSDVKPTKNRASFNGDLGINAGLGTIDGGKNVVQDNGDNRQCLNVACAEVSS